MFTQILQPIATGIEDDSNLHVFTNVFATVRCLSQTFRGAFQELSGAFCLVQNSGTRRNLRSLFCTVQNKKAPGKLLKRSWKAIAAFF